MGSDGRASPTGVLLFELAAPWWELPLRVFAIYSVLLILVATWWFLERVR